MKKRLFGILISFAMMLTMMPGMSLTAYADDSYKLTLSVGENGTFVAGPGVYGNGSGDPLLLQGPMTVSGNISVSDGVSMEIHGGDITFTTGGTWNFYPASTNTGVITAVPADGYVFDGWYNGETLYSDNAELDYKNISKNITLIAKFASPVTKYPLWVGGTQVTSANKDDPGNRGWSYTPATTGENPTPAKLKLNNFSCSESGDKNAAIYAEEDLVIETSGTNNVANTSTAGGTRAIGVTGELTFKGSGTLNATGGNKTIEANAVTIESGTVNTSNGNYGIYASSGDVIIKNGTVIATNTPYNPAIYAKQNITIKGGNVKATGYYGIRALNKLTIEGGIIKATDTNTGILCYSVDIYNGTIEATGTTYGIFSTGVITINGGQVTASGGSRALNYNRNENEKNEIPGTGWTDTAGETGEANIAVGEHSLTELAKFKKVQFPAAHTHVFAYTASGDTITATCSAEGCPLPVVGDKHVATLTIAAEGGTYDGTTAFGASITDQYNIRGSAAINYYKAKADGSRGDALNPVTDPPKKAGKYWAEITLGPGTDEKTATAHVVYNIAKATPSITTNPTASEITYGQTLESSTLTGGAAKLGEDVVQGTFAWKTKTTAPAVSDSQSTEYDVVFTPNDTDNYNTSECKVKLTVNRKEVGLSWTNTSLTYNGQEQAPTATATQLVSGDAGKVSVTVTGGQTDASTTAYTATASELTGDKANNYKLPNDKTTSFTISPKPISGATVTLSETSLDYTGTEQSVSVTSVKLDGTELSATTDYTVSGDTGTDAGTYTVTVTGKGNYKDSAEAQWSITATPTIDPAPTASDITYGQTLSDSKLTGGKAKVGDTEVPGTFSWKNGSTRPSVADSEETEYAVVFTPTGTTKYKPAETKVKLTVNKGEPTAAAVTANNRKYDGTKKPLVKADESILSGGTMQYALGSDDKTAPDKGWGESIPEAAEKGTYYVWYMVKGDANHNDSEPQSVTVTISEKGPEPVDESTITFDLNGGTLNGKTGKVAVKVNNGTVITLPEPTRDGYTFDYWEGSKYNAGDKYTVNGDHTFKAVWKTAAGGNGSKGGSSRKGVNTGDENTLGAWIVLIVAALAGTTGMAFARKRRDD